MRSAEYKAAKAKLAAHRAEQRAEAIRLEAAGLWGSDEAVAAREAAFEVEVALAAEVTRLRGDEIYAAGGALEDGPS